MSDESKKQLNEKGSLDKQGESAAKDSGKDSAAKEMSGKSNVSAKPDRAPKIRPKASIGAEAQTDESMNRRTFFSWLTIAWVAFTGATLAFFTMLARFMFPNVLFEPPQTFKAGYPDEYSIGEVSTRWKAKYAVWICRNAEYIYALSTVCTHLGCTPNWLPSDRKFKCPCHGSGYKFSGINFEGPAPRPLERYKIVLAEDGQILVDKSKKYQQEKGQWKDPESFLVV